MGPRSPGSGKRTRNSEATPSEAYADEGRMVPATAQATQARGAAVRLVPVAAATDKPEKRAGAAAGTRGYCSTATTAVHIIVTRDVSGIKTRTPAIRAASERPNRS